MEEEPVFCPVCGEETEQVPVKAGKKSLIKCTKCETLRPVQVTKEKLATVKMIVNRDDAAQPYMINLPAEGDIRVGDEILVDDGRSDVVLARITSIEADRRVNKSPAKDIKTAWARAVDEVALKISVFRHGRTQSLKQTVPGDEVVEIGEIRDAEGVRYKVTKIKLRGEGFAEDTAEAKEITRVWGRALEDRGGRRL